MTGRKELQNPLRRGGRALIFPAVLPVLTLVATGLCGSEPSQSDEGEDTRVAARPRTVADLPMTPEVRRVWDIVLEEAGMAGALDEIVLPEKLGDFPRAPYPVYEMTVRSPRGGRIYLFIDPGTGDLLLWSDHSGSGEGGGPVRNGEEVQKRTAELAAKLFPGDLDRDRLPEYSDNIGAWRVHWHRTANGLNLPRDGYTIQVSDRDLSLVHYARFEYETAPVDLTPEIEAETARDIAIQSMVDLKNRRTQAFRDSEERLREQADKPLPKVKALACREPELRIMPYDPGYFLEMTWSDESHKAGRELRLAWDVKMNVFVKRDDGCWNVYAEELWIDASTGEVAGGSGLACVAEYCPEGENDDLSGVNGCWFWD